MKRYFVFHSQCAGRWCVFRKDKYDRIRDYGKFKSRALARQWCAVLNNGLEAWRVTWSGGNGPHEYVRKRDDFYTLETNPERRPSVFVGNIFQVESATKIGLIAMNPRNKTAAPHRKE